MSEAIGSPKKWDQKGEVFKAYSKKSFKIKLKYIGDVTQQTYSMDWTT